MVKAGERMGLEAVEVGAKGVTERAVDEELAGRLERARRWVGAKVWFGICFRKTA